MENKTYSIAGTEFQLKDLTLKEAEEVQKTFKSLTANNQNEILADLSNESAREFLSTVLTPKRPAVFFDDATEMQFLEIFKDFFLARLKQGKNLENFFTNLTMK